MRAVGLSVVALLATGAADARIPVYESDHFGLSVGGYVRAVGGYAEFDGLLADGFGSSMLISQMEVRASVSDWAVVETHGRVAWGSGGVFGSRGVEPQRAVDLRHEEQGLTLDVDRLVARLYLGPVDLSVGRQEVTWGSSQIFTVADLFTTFDPFALDNTQKPGVDAIRQVWGITNTVELDFVVVARGRSRDTSGGVRASLYLPFGDLWLGAAKIYEELGTMGGFTVPIDTFTVRGEIVGIYDTTDRAFQLPRATLGLDWMHSGDLALGLEVHHSGAAGEADVLERGEVYLPKTWYGSVYGRYKPHELIAIAVSPIIDFDTPSAILTWSVGYDLAQDVDLSLGAFHVVGGWPNTGGEGGHFVYLQLAAFL